MRDTIEFHVEHNCSLVTSTTFKEDSKSWIKQNQLKLAYIKVASLSEWNRRWRIFFQGKADYINEHHYHMGSPYWYILNPYSKAMFLWNLFAFVMCLLYVLLEPVEEVVQTSPGMERSWLIFSYYISFFLCLDIVVTCLRGWPLFDKKIIVYHPGKIFLCYMKSRFFLPDLMTAWPLELHVSYVMQTYPSTAAILAAVPVFNLIQFLMFFGKFPKLMFYFSEIANIFHLTGNRKRLVRIILICLLAHHVFACCHLHTGGRGKFQEFYSRDKSTWIWKMKVADSTPLLLYLIAYWRSLKLTLSGETVHLENLNEMIISWFNRISSYFWFTLTVVQLNLLKISLDDKYEQFLTYVREFMRNKLVFPHIQRRILNYFNYYIRKGRYIDEDNLLQLLPEKLRLEIMAAKCYYLVEKAYLFADIPRDIVQKMCSELIAEIYLSNDVIIKAGLVGSDMFFIAQGTVKILTPLGKEVALLEDGDHFGEVSLIFENQKRMASVLAVENCLIYRLKKCTFDKLIRPNETIMKLIVAKANARIFESRMVDKNNSRFLQEFRLAGDDDDSQDERD